MARLTPLRTLLAAGLAIVAFGACGALGDARVCHKHEVTSDGGYFIWDIKTDASGTVMDRWNMVVNPPTLIDRNTYAALHQPASGTEMWGEGVAFAAAMASRSSPAGGTCWFGGSPTAEAYWSRDPVTLVDTWRFLPEQITFRSTDCGDVPSSPGGSPQPATPTTTPTTTTPPVPTPEPNCPYAGSSGGGVTCDTATETCCGYSSMNPQCIPNGSTDKCCPWYLASTTCTATQSCCGGSGPGASSVAFCCDEGSTCCSARSPTAGPSSCCPAGSTCCAGASIGLCCAAGEECVPDSNTCRPAGGTAETTTSNAPAIPTTTSAPSSSGDSHHVCLQVGSTFFDITADASSTTLKRWNTAVSPATLIDTNGFAALHQPASPSDMWGEGVAYAATMQTRSAWVNTDPNAAAYWEPVSAGVDTWRFQSTAAGAPVEFVFRTSQCEVPPPPAVHHVCLQVGSVYYDITADASSTTLKRWNTAVSPATLIDTNGFAALHQPASPSDMWGEGVAYAATMQTRSAWVNTDPNPAAYWEAGSGVDTWRFQSTVSGAPVEFVFRTSQCLNL